MAGDDGVESPRFCLPAEEGKLGGGIAENARVGSLSPAVGFSPGGDNLPLEPLFFLRYDQRNAHGVRCGLRRFDSAVVSGGEMQNQSGYIVPLFFHQVDADRRVDTAGKRHQDFVTFHRPDAPRPDLLIPLRKE